MSNESRFLIFNDNDGTVIDINTIVLFSINDDIIYFITKYLSEQLQMEYSSKRKALNDYNMVSEIINAKEMPIQRFKRKPSLQAEAMKEVNEFLGKSRIRGEDK